MSDENINECTVFQLENNDKLFVPNGYIGRRDYFLNCIYIISISLFFTLPFNIWTMTQINGFSDYFKLNSLFIGAPFLLKIWFSIGMTAVSVLFVINSIKRLNDINGKKNKTVNILCSILIVSSYFGFFLPSALFFAVSILSFVLVFVLLLKRGKITSKLPYDFKKEFNWGAFLGTWLWGLYNKSYIPLLYIPLFFTPWNIYFMFYCGIKGNEWAFKNKNWENAEKFNKSQEKQTVFWAIFDFIIIPVIYFVLVFACVMYLFLQPAKSDNSKVPLEKIVTLFENICMSYFESYNIEETENKFYIKPESWNKYSYNNKKDIIDIAANVSVQKRRKEYLSKNPEKYKIFTRSEELKRTKIYSSKNSELLGEYKSDTDISGKENKSLMNAVKEELKAYKFYQASD